MPSKDVSFVMVLVAIIMLILIYFLLQPFKLSFFEKKLEEINFLGSNCEL